MPNRVSLAELAASDIRLRPGEAVAIVSAICDQRSAGTLPGIPSPGVIRLTREGDVIAEGPITTAQDEVARAALLLTHLLSGFDVLPEYRASGALRLVVARALGTIDLPAYASLSDFCAALSRFATDDVREVARGLFGAWERAHAARAFKVANGADLTISDVRRARRATGLSLHQVAAVAEVPPTRLRDLEWGYMRDWPATPDGRAQVIRYARAAGLDESIVLSIAWPMIVEGTAVTGPDTEPGVALVRSAPVSMAIARTKPEAAARPPVRRALVGAAAILAMLGAFAFGWRSSHQPQSPTPRHETLQVGMSGQEAPPVEIVPAVTRDEPVTLGAPRREAPPRSAVRKAKLRRASAAGARPASRKQSFFERELFRIVVR